MVMILKDYLVKVFTIGIEVLVALKRNTKILLLPSPTAKLEKQLKKKMTASIELQRNGKIKEYAEASKEIFDMQEELDKLTSESNKEKDYKNEM
jgi:hypothetical protein